MRCMSLVSLVKQGSLTVSMVLLAAVSAICQKEVNFHLIEGMNGEHLGKITSITQDPQGFMWFASEGQKCIYRYDGVVLKAYRHDNLNKNSLGGNNVFMICADHKGRIWVGLQGEGLDRLDPSTGKFEHYKHDKNIPSSLGSNGVGPIVEDKQGRIWVGTSKGLDLFDEKSGQFIHYRNVPGDPKSLSDNVVTAIYEDRGGVLWVGTGMPWFKIDPEKGGLNRLEKDGTFTRFMHDPTNPNTLISNKVRSIFEDSRGVFWVGTSGDGLHTMNRQTGEVTRHRYDPAHPEKLARPPRQTDDWHNYNDQVTLIKEDRRGHIWIGSMWNGLNRYDPVAKKVTHLGSSAVFPDSSGWNAYTSRDGVLWLTTEQQNLYRIDVIEKKVKDFQLNAYNPTVHRFVEDKKGFLWVATGDGLFQLDQNKQVVNHFVPEPGDESPFNDLSSLLLNNDDSLWIGANRGKWTFNFHTKKFRKFIPDRRVKDADAGNVISIFQDKKGLMWFTTDKGVQQYSPKERSVKWYQADGRPGSLSSDHIICIDEGQGSIWVGTGDNGLNRWDPKTDRFTHLLDDAKIVSLHFDSEGVLWVGTASGLYRYNEWESKFTLFGEGAVIGHDRIYAIAEDDQKNLWVATPNALTKVNAQRNEVTSYGYFVGMFNLSPGSLFIRRNKEILVGYNDGYYAFSPEEIARSAESFDILLSDLFVNNVPLRMDSLTRISKGNGKESLRVNLRHDENNLTFKYAIDNYRALEATKYSTMLENYDNIWREAGSDKASYFLNLPPGKYKYRIKAHSAFGEKAEMTIDVVIAPPWWKTYWAYALYGLIGVSILFVSRKEILRRERLRSAFKMEHMELEKAKEVDKVKSTFYANISHEFRTPLTLIKGPVEDLIEKYKTDTKTQEKLHLVQRNADLLLKLINQLLNLAKIEAGGQKIENSEFEISFFIRAVASSFLSMAMQKKVTLHIDSPPGEYTVSMDKDKLETMLINLINNAIKFTGPGGFVGVQARVNNAEGPAMARLEISVRDTGIGIPEKMQAKVFERFFQVSESHKEVGSGIGLSLVWELAHFMNGNVSVKSEIGKGSEFILTLPVNVLSESKRTGEDATLSALSQYGAGPGPETEDSDEIGEKPVVLVIEDNFDMRKFIVESLSGFYRILEAEDGSHGIDRAVSEIPRLIVSDVMMPETDGIALTKRLKKDFRTCHIPIILLTAKVTEENKLEGLETGADDYIAKPFNKQELLLKVRNNVSRQEKIRDKIRMELLREVPRLDVQSADEKFLVKVRDTIHQRLGDEQLGVESLAEDIGMSRVQLYRKITALTGLSVNEMIRTFRLQKAAQLLEQNWGSISQITYEVGFSNPSYFSKCFKEKFGVIPSEYLAKKPMSE